MHQVFCHFVSASKDVGDHPSCRTRFLHLVEVKLNLLFSAQITGQCVRGCFMISEYTPFWMEYLQNRKLQRSLELIQAK